MYYQYETCPGYMTSSKKSFQRKNVYLFYVQDDNNGFYQNKCPNYYLPLLGVECLMRGGSLLAYDCIYWFFNFYKFHDNPVLPLRSKLQYRLNSP